MNAEEMAASIPFARGCGVICRLECGLLAIYKRAGRMSHPNPPRRGGRASQAVPMVLADYDFAGECYRWRDESSGESLRLYLVNRLDSPTSGVLVASLSKEAAIAAKREFAARRVKKTYYAVCVGVGIQKCGKWTDRIREVGGRNFVRGAAGAVGKLASTNFFVESLDKNSAGLSLVRLEPETGLTHQLRIQCAARKMPILGDATYGNFSANKRFKSIAKIDRLFLHCAKTELEIDTPGGKARLAAESPLPDSFLEIMQYNPKIFRSFH